MKALSPEVNHGVLHPVSEGGTVDRFCLVVGSEALGDDRKLQFTSNELPGVCASLIPEAPPKNACCAIA